MLQDAEEHYQTLLQASPKLHVLDDYTVGRVFEIFGSQRNDLWLFEEQLPRWRWTNSVLASAKKWTDWRSKLADAGLSLIRSFRSLNN